MLIDLPGGQRQSSRRKNPWVERGIRMGWIRMTASKRWEERTSEGWRPLQSHLVVTTVKQRESERGAV